MARKLFALENLDEESGEMESGTEVTELASVEVEAGDDVKDIVSDAESVEGGVAGAEDAEKVEDFVGDVVEKGESLDKVAAEAIRIAMESICARVGYNPKSVRAMYATENFSSASSCKTSTAIALEGVGEFLKDLWKKIKETLSNLWKKVKAFWMKHLSSLGRARKALTAAKTRVSASSGKFKGQAFIDEAPSSLVNAFAGKEDINANLVKTYLTNHALARSVQLKMIELFVNMSATGDITKSLQDALASLKANSSFTYGTPEKPLIGGVYKTIAITVEAQDATVEISTDSEVIEKEAKLGVSLADKAGLGEIIAMSSEILKHLEDLIKNSEKYQDRFSKVMQFIDKALNAINDNIGDAGKSAVKEARSYIKIAYKLQAKLVGVAPEIYHNDIRAVKASLMYIDLCVRNYK